MTAPYLRHDTTTPIPVWVRGLRAKLGYSQWELAYVVGVHRQTVTRWETGVMWPSARARHHLNFLARTVGYAPLAARRRVKAGATIISRAKER